jgi:hypothetical protein
LILVKTLPMENNGYFFQLLATSFSGSADAVQLAELNDLIQNDPELKHTMEILQGYWEQEPETDHMALSAAWERLKQKL